MKKILTIVLTFLAGSLQAQQFVHPGMMQTREDLAYMKQQVLSGKEPWKNAYAKLQKNTSLDFKPSPRAHISIGPYGANSSGGRELSMSANAVYDHALMWYITGNKAYAAKAIEILNAWAYRLWDFDDNNAKLSVALTAYYFLNAAEILKYSDSGWKQEDMEQFKRLMLTVYYPTVKDFFTEANGNWDAAIINTLLCIGVFTDNREIFNSAVERFYRGPGNSGITKYIYSNGQVQETTRDWGHVQLGIGEFAKAAQVAWTQGEDFYGAANNRLALGYEYTAKFMLGGEIPVYGVLSHRAKEHYRDIYESIYHHYHEVKGLEMPFTKRVLDEHTRRDSAVDVLMGIRAPLKTKPVKTAFLPYAPLRGALEKAVEEAPASSVVITPGGNIQQALDAAAGTGKWVVLDTGVHILKAPLKMPGGVTLAGKGNRSILILSPEQRTKTIVNADSTMHDVTIRDLLIEGAVSPVTNNDPNADRRNRSYMNAPSREGILFMSDRAGQMRNIRFVRLTVQNFTKNGVSVRGAENVTVEECDFSDNGSSVVPGAGFHHNLHLSHVQGVSVKNSRFDTSPWGSGIDLSFCTNAGVEGNETARNKLSGIRCTESSNVRFRNNLSEGNDENGLRLDALMDGVKNFTLEKNITQYNGGAGVFISHPKAGKVLQHSEQGNGK
ncbi:alginate lyase family protein [Chitinophaga sp. GCM10012297]|uniref:Alginate lyase family protein n=1 Tax=Chitinophaga chungangae TaxID=2821488 RepID=A0ABS3YD58_9BACT|nr:alginate lyase family protein [Chitinophaga chungangae]MBO9152395.1 alginate lyase family protein [Chitinophaga chungangae]